MQKNLEEAKKSYMTNAANEAKETFNYFQVGDAYTAGAEKAIELSKSVFNRFLERCGHFIQGVDSEEIYDMYKMSQDEVFEK